MPRLPNSRRQTRQSRLALVDDLIDQQDDNRAYIDPANREEVRLYIMEHNPNDPAVFPDDLARRFRNVRVAYRQAMELYRLNPQNRDLHVHAGRLHNRMNRLGFELGIQLQRMAHIHQNPELQHNGYQMETDPGYVRWRQIEAEQRLRSAGQTWRDFNDEFGWTHMLDNPGDIDAIEAADEIRRVFTDEQALGFHNNAEERRRYWELDEVGGVPRENDRELNFLPLPTMPIVAGMQGAWRPEGFRGVAPGSGG